MSANYLRRLSKWLPSSLQRMLISLWPPFWAMGIKLEKCSPDFRQLETSMKLHWYNVNYVGVHFGGGIYVMADPFYMLMLIKNLGNEYIVWDKGASIDFKKPGLGTLRATFIFSEEEIEYIRQQANEHNNYTFDKSVDVVNEQNIVVATIVKTLYVRRKDKAVHTLKVIADAKGGKTK
ncbi:MAG: DUF4442 domain-containing protein [Gammaproteobacteria bacterium]